MFPNGFFPQGFFPESFFPSGELVSSGHAGKETINTNTDSNESAILTEVLERQVIPEIVEIPPSSVVEYQENETRDLIEKAIANENRPNSLQDKISGEEDVLLIMAIIEAYED